MAARSHKTYFIRTFGCQMNEHDSGRMASLLRGMGYHEAASPEEADLILFNTCTVREKAYHKAESEIGRAQLRKARHGTVVGVCGCVAQQDGVSLKDRFPGIDFIFGPDQLASLPHLIASAERGVFSSALDFIDDPNHPDVPYRIAEGSITGGSAFVAVMKGCDCSCTYCIVPRVRGRAVSRPASDIVEEVTALVQRGAKEVTLLGQNVNGYGKNQEGAPSFVSLLKRIARIEGLERIRFTSPHPRDVDDELIDLYGTEEKICPHIHLPVQAGSNRILGQMRRGYTRERIFELVDRLRHARPGIAITTDMIVGFCGETDEDFTQTVDLMERVRFDSMFAFCYSPRPGTYAADALHDSVPSAVKKQRLERVLSLQRSIQFDKNKALVGRVASALVIKTDERGEKRLTGRAADNRLVHFSGHDRMIGTIVSLRITRASIHSLQGEIED